MIATVTEAGLPAITAVGRVDPSDTVKVSSSSSLSWLADTRLTVLLRLPAGTVIAEAVTV